MTGWVDDWKTERLRKLKVQLSKMFLNQFLNSYCKISWIFQNIPNFLYVEGLKEKLSEIRKYANLSKSGNLTFFEDFTTFFLIPKAQEYQNEKTPNLKGQKKVKASGKLQKIPHLQPPNWNYPYWMTLYTCILILLSW